MVAVVGMFRLLWGNLQTERAKVAKFYYARSKTISSLPWLTIELPLSKKTAFANLEAVRARRRSRGDATSHERLKTGFHLGIEYSDPDDIRVYAVHLSFVTHGVAGTWPLLQG